MWKGIASTIVCALAAAHLTFNTHAVAQEGEAAQSPMQFEERFPAEDVPEIQPEDVQPERAFNYVSIYGSGECGRGGQFKRVRNINRDRSIRVTVRIWDNIDNFDYTRSYNVRAGGNTALPGCSRPGGGQTVTYRIVGAEYN